MSVSLRTPFCSHLISLISACARRSLGGGPTHNEVALVCVCLSGGGGVCTLPWHRWEHKLNLRADRSCRQHMAALGRRREVDTERGLSFIQRFTVSAAPQSPTSLDDWVFHTVPSGVAGVGAEGRRDPEAAEAPVLVLFSLTQSRAVLQHRRDGQLKGQSSNLEASGRAPPRLPANWVLMNHRFGLLHVPGDGWRRWLHWRSPLLWKWSGQRGLLWLNRGDTAGLKLSASITHQMFRTEARGSLVGSAQWK